jgi:hypothetical protein
MQTTSLRKGLLSLLLVSLLLSTAGCSLQAELMALALEFWPEYLAYKLKGTSGIPEVDAVLEAKAQLDKIDKADKLAAEGRKKGDVDKVREAMAMRPGDWRYGYQAGAVLLEQGDVKGADSYFTSTSYGGQNTIATGKPAVEGESRVYPKDQYAIEVLEESRQKMQDRGWKSREQCVYTYDQLIWHYQAVAPSAIAGPKSNVAVILAQLRDEQARFCPK